MKRHSRKEPEHPFDNLDIEFDHKTEDKGYTRYKHRCYRNLILKSLLAFVLGLFLAAFLRFLVSHTPRSPLTGARIETFIKTMKGQEE